MEPGASTLRQFAAELRRRRVFRVAAAYLVIAWALVQGMDAVLPITGAPEWVAKVVLALLALGFPAALVMAWAFDITADGVRRTAAVAAGAAPAVPPPPRRALLAAILLLALASGGWWAAGRMGAEAAATASLRSIAVLPFSNMSGDDGSEYFSDGITEDILTQLAGIEGLTVTSRTTVMQYKSTEKSIREIGRELGAGVILEGSVRHAGGRVRIVAQLIEAATDRHLWAATYDRDMQDIFAVQSDVAENIAAALRIQLTPADRAVLDHRPTDNTEAYQLYLQGRHAARRVVYSEMEAGLALFSRATELDPQFAAAYAATAQTYVWMSVVAQQEPRAIYEPAIAAARRALELDPKSADALAATGALRLAFEWDWRGADEALDNALQIDPDNEDALTWKVLSLMYRERTDEAIALGERWFAAQPGSAWAGGAVGQTLAISGRTEDAIAVLERSRDLNPTSQGGYYWLMYAYALAGRWADAERAYERSFDNNRPVPLWQAVRGALYAAGGRPDEARATLAELRRRENAGEYIEPYAYFSLRVALGDMDAGMRELQRAVVERSPVLIYIRAVPRWRPLREDPRFMAALREVWPDDFD